MTRTRILFPILLLISALALSCVPKPKMSYSTEQLTKLSEVAELMRCLYQDLSPVWAAAKKENFTAEGFPEAMEAGPRVEAISAALISKQVTGRFKEGFAAHASKLGEHAGAMTKAAGAKDEAAVRKALAGINSSCSSCHQQFK